MQEISEDIMVRAQSGDLRAFGEIYKISSGFVYSLALRMLRNTTDAEEITQDVFVKVFKSLKQYEGRSSFKTWIYRITMNTVINFCKKQASEAKKRVEWQTSLEESSTSFVKTEKTSQSEAEEKLGEFLALLNDDQRACILLREIDGLDYQQIATILKINLNTVRSRLKRARETMLAFAKQKREESSK